MSERDVVKNEGKPKDAAHEQVITDTQLSKDNDESFDSLDEPSSQLEDDEDSIGLRFHEEEPQLAKRDRLDNDETFDSLNEPFSQLEDDENSIGLRFHKEEPQLAKRDRFSAPDLEAVTEEDFSDVGKLRVTAADDMRRIQNAIGSVALFHGYDQDELKVVAEYMYLRQVACDEVVIRFGDTGDAFYVVKSGRYRCTVPNDSGGKEKEVCVYDNTGCFGELALVNRAPRAATVRALTAGELWCLCAMRCAWLRKRMAEANAQRFDQVLNAIPLFRDSMEPGHRNRLIDAIETEALPAGEIICRQGEPGDAMYFVLEGEVVASIDGTPVKTLKQNDFFGERALVLEEGRAATCQTTLPSKIAKLSQVNFELLIPDNVVEQMRRYISVNYNKGSSKTSEETEDSTEEILSESGVCAECACQDTKD